MKSSNIAKYIVALGLAFAIASCASIDTDLATMPPPPLPPPPPAGGVEPQYPAPTPLQQRKHVATTVRVFFGTNRAKTSVPGYEGRFANAAGPTVNYGSIDVGVPRVHERGIVERPNWLLGRIFEADPRRHFVIGGLTLMDRTRMLAAIRGRIGQATPAGQRVALVFVHGFNVSFDDAALRTAQMAYDLEFSGVPIFYSWPSRRNTSPLGYTNDSSRIEEARPHLKRFISDVITQAGADKVYIVAHSMGTRGVTRVLAELGQSHSAQTRKIAALILAAPDINANVFRNDIAPKLGQMALRTTLYASGEDLALRASHKIAGAYALGDARGGISVYPGMDSIDATAAGTSFLGHSSYGDSPVLLNDIKAVIRGLTPSQRAWLRRSPSPGTRHYVLDAAASR